MSHRFRALFVVFLATLTVVLAGCSKGEGGTSANLHFLLASDEGLTEVTGGKSRVIANFDDGSYILDPTLSQDGKRVAFVRQPPAVTDPVTRTVDFGSDVYTVNRDGSDVRLIAKHSVIGEFLRSPAILGDGSVIFGVRGTSATGAQDFHIDKVDGQDNRKRLTEDAVDPVMSRGGGLMAFVHIDPVSQEEQLRVQRMATGETKTLVSKANNLALLQSAVFTPDGSKVAFAAVDLTSPVLDPNAPQTPPPGTSRFHPFAQDVWIVNTDGSDLHRLYELTENQPSLGFSPDGTFLYALGPTGFWRIEVATKEREQIGMGIPLGQIHIVK